MTEKKEQQQDFSTCLEDYHFAQALQKNEEISRFGSAGQIAAEPQNSTVETQLNSKNQSAGIVGSIMKLHPCADCPVRRLAVAKPRSLFARIHGWHKTWWPGWKVYQAELHTCNARLQKNESAQNSYLTC